MQARRAQVAAIRLLQLLSHERTAAHDRCRLARTRLPRLGLQRSAAAATPTVAVVSACRPCSRRRRRAGQTLTSGTRPPWRAWAAGTSVSGAPSRAGHLPPLPIPCSPTLSTPAPTLRLHRGRRPAHDDGLRRRAPAHAHGSHGGHAVRGTHGRCRLCARPHNGRRQNGGRRRPHRLQDRCVLGLGT